MFLPVALHLISHSYCTAPCPHCLPALLLLFIILWWESCCCFSACAASTGLLITSPAAESSVPSLPPLPLFVIHCVVTLIIMDSARVFRLSAGSWSPRTAHSSSTCAQTCTGMHPHTWVQTHTHTAAVHTSRVYDGSVSSSQMWTSVGATQVVCVLRPVRTPQAPMNAHVPLASVYPAMARTVKVCVCVCVNVCSCGCVCIHVSVLMHVIVCFC